MDDVKILLFDLNPSGPLGSQLEAILKSSFKPGMQLRYESVGVFDPSLCGTYVSNIICRVTPELMFLIFSPSHVKRVVPLVRSMGRESSDFPIIAVTERCKPDKMFELLKAGIADFITPPFKTIDVLPRMWRLFVRIWRNFIDKLAKMMKPKS